MSDVTALMDALQPHVRLHRARLFTLAALVLPLARFRTTNLARLCLALPGRAHESSAYRRLQRFFAEVALGADALHGLPVAHAPEGPLLLALDRTEWKAAGHVHNLLVIGHLHSATRGRDGVVVPLAWRALGKPGSSSQAERIALRAALFERLPAERVEAVLGDREFLGEDFLGEDFLGWLDARRIGFVVRIKKNAWLRHVRSGAAYQAGPLFALLRDGGRRGATAAAREVAGLRGRLLRDGGPARWLDVGARLEPAPGHGAGALPRAVVDRDARRNAFRLRRAQEPGVRPGGDPALGGGADRAAVRLAGRGAGVGARGRPPADGGASGAGEDARAASPIAVPRVARHAHAAPEPG